MIAIEVWRGRRMRSARTALAAVLALVVLVLAGTRSGRTQAALAPLPQTAEAPPDNPTTPEKVALGWLLFWDPILSGDRDVSCATCHHPQFGYSENRDLSIGVSGIGLGANRRFSPGSTIPLVKRNSQTVLNVAFNGIGTTGPFDPAMAPMFWDVRVRSLESQALEPIKALEEMRGQTTPEDRILDVVVGRIASIDDYRARFARAFGGATPVNAINLGRALASFQRSLLATDSPFDRYMRGDRSAMSEVQVRGMARFERAGCANCHNGPMFSDFTVHVLGVPDNRALGASDTGWDGTFAFRTPSLRNLAFTAPYMHNGVFRTLDDVLNFYDDVQGGRGGRGGRQGRRNPNVSRAQLDPLLRRVNVNGQRELVAFLNALNDANFDRTIPARVPSGLAPGGRIDEPPAEGR
jgi:cytochrome c peroxidase